MRRFAPVPLLVAACPRPAATPASPIEETAFVDVTVVPMDRPGRAGTPDGDRTRRAGRRNRTAGVDSGRRRKSERWSRKMVDPRPRRHARPHMVSRAARAVRGARGHEPPNHEGRSRDDWSSGCSRSRRAARRAVDLNDVRTARGAWSRSTCAVTARDVAAWLLAIAASDIAIVEGTATWSSERRSSADR